MSTEGVTLNWTPFALACLDQIHDYITFREKSPDPASKFLDAIFTRVEQLKKFPESGQVEPLLLGIGKNSRYLVEASYKIIYEFHPIDKTVVVTDVFHTSQYPKKIHRSKK